MILAWASPLSRTRCNERWPHVIFMSITPVHHSTCWPDISFHLCRWGYSVAINKSPSSGWLVGWWTGLFAGCLVWFGLVWFGLVWLGCVGLAGWLVDFLVRVRVRVHVLMVDWMVRWLIGCTWLVSWLIFVFIDWLFGWLVVLVLWSGWELGSMVWDG